MRLNVDLTKSCEGMNDRLIVSDVMNAWLTLVWGLERSEVRVSWLCTWVVLTIDERVCELMLRPDMKSWVKRKRYLGLSHVNLINGQCIQRMATRIQKVDYLNIRGSYETLSCDSHEFKGWVTKIERVF